MRVRLDILGMSWELIHMGDIMGFSWEYNQNLNMNLLLGPKVDTEDACEILHNPKDGWNPNKIMGCLPPMNWSRISSTVLPWIIQG